MLASTVQTFTCALLSAMSSKAFAHWLSGRLNGHERRAGPAAGHCRSVSIEASIAEPSLERPEIYGERAHHCEAAHHVSVWVEDTGVGIPPDEVAKLFINGERDPTKP